MNNERERIKALRKALEQIKYSHSRSPVELRTMAERALMADSMAEIAANFLFKTKLVKKERA